MKYKKNSHCSFCGTAFAEGQAWPRRCGHCGNMTFLNPIPVVVMLQPFDSGLLVIRRNIEPHKGQLALPGGYIDEDENWDAAGARELFEETGIEVEPKSVKLFAVHATGEGFLLVFGLAPTISLNELPAFEANDEIAEVVIIGGPIELAFPLHTLVVEAFFEQL